MASDPRITHTTSPAPAYADEPTRSVAGRIPEGFAYLEDRVDRLTDVVASMRNRLEAILDAVEV